MAGATTVMGLLLAPLSVAARGEPAAGVRCEGPAAVTLRQSEAPDGWRHVPRFLRGGWIYSKRKGHPDPVARFRVVEGGAVYLACHFGYEGNPGGGWLEERLTLEDFVKQGWKPVAEMISGQAQPFTVLVRSCKEGEHFQLRSNKYSTPHVLVPPARPEPLAPGAIACKDLAPEPLVETDKRDGWKTVPACLQGAQIYSRKVRAHGAVADFRVTRSGTLYLACHLGYEGNPQGGWSKRSLTEAEFLQRGWCRVGEMTYGNGRVFTLFERLCDAGDRFRLRCNKYTPPFVIIPKGTSAPEI